MEQARDGRIHILGEMSKALTSGREDVAATAPRITIITVPKEKIRDVIGTGGKVIREIVELTGAKIDIEDDGTIKIASSDPEKAQAAIDRIRGIVAEPEVGVIYNGKVVKTAEFGAFVNFLGSKDGLVHISELQQGRVKQDDRRGQPGRRREGEGHGLRRPRQGEAVHACGRSGDRRGHLREGRAEGRRRAGAWRSARAPRIDRGVMVSPAAAFRGQPRRRRRAC